MIGGPDVSVVMSVYNNANSLPATMESLLSQEGVKLEFIVIDDGSTDGSGQILDEVAAREPRLKVVHKKNEGLTRALIEGCEMVTAPWIARQDADDRSFPGRLRAQLDRALQPDAPVLIGCAVSIKTPTDELIHEYHPPVDPVLAGKRILEEGQAISSHGSILFSRTIYEKVGGYRAPFFYAQDIDLTTRLAEVGPVSAVDSVLYEYIFSPTAISGRFGRFQSRYYGLIREGHARRKRGLTEDDLLEQAEALRQECLRFRGQKKSSFEADYFIGTCLLEKNPAAASVYLLNAARSRPWSVKAWVRLLQSSLIKQRRVE